MTERIYTVAELDALRRVVETKWLYGVYRMTPEMLGNGYGCSRSYRPEEKTACVEELVRTHMMAGHTAEDLLASEAERRTPTKEEVQEACDKINSSFGAR